MTTPLAGAEAYVDVGVEPATTRILYVQAPGFPRAALVARLREAGLLTTMVTDAGDGLRRLGEETFALCLVDLAGGRAGQTAARLIRAHRSSLPVVGVIDVSSPAMAAEATHAGLTDVLAWPLDAAELAAVLAEVRDRAPAAVPPQPDGNLLTAASPAMRDVLRQVREVARTRKAVCLAGPKGSGRSLLARAFHEASTGNAGPYVVVECGGQSPSALEHELFGVAVFPRQPSDAAATEVIAEASAVAMARGGTLVLKDLDEAPSRVQTRLAALLRDREVVVGTSTRPVDVNLRFVATLSLGTPTSDGVLGPELAGRFAARIDVPPLRRRREDIPIIAARHLAQLAVADGGHGHRLSCAALELLGALPWPGNVPELKRVVEAVASDTRRTIVQLDDVLRHVTLDGAGHVSNAQDLRQAREQFERECIESALARVQGRVGEAARVLGIQRTNLYRKLRQLGISRTLLSGHR